MGKRRESDKEKRRLIRAVSRRNHAITHIEISNRHHLAPFRGLGTENAFAYQPWLDPVPNELKDVRLGTLQNSWRTIRTKRLLVLGRLEEGWENRKRDGEEERDLQHFFLRCAQATICQPSSDYLRRSSSPFCVSDFSRFVLVRGTHPAVSCVAVSVRGS